MSRASVLLSALTNDPASTSDLYQRVGYAALTRLGLVSYDAFRAELAKLAAAGLAQSEVGHDGSTMWRLTELSRPAETAFPHPEHRLTGSDPGCNTRASNH